MVDYNRWVSILFEVHPEADATEIFRVAGREWSSKKQALQDASVSEAREHAKTL